MGCGIGLLLNLKFGLGFDLEYCFFCDGFLDVCFGFLDLCLGFLFFCCGFLDFCFGFLLCCLGFLEFCFGFVFCFLDLLLKKLGLNDLFFILKEEVLVFCIGLMLELKLIIFFCKIVVFLVVFVFCCLIGGLEVDLFFFLVVVFLFGKMLKLKLKFFCGGVGDF